MQIAHDKKKLRSYGCHEKYIEQVLNRFNIKNVKLVSTLLANHFTLSKKSYFSTQKEIEEIVIVSYSQQFGV